MCPYKLLKRRPVAVAMGLFFIYICAKGASLLHLEEKNERSKVSENAVYPASKQNVV